MDRDQTWAARHSALLIHPQAQGNHVHVVKTRKPDDTDDVGQTFLSASSRRFPAPGTAAGSRQPGKAVESTDKNVRPAEPPSRLLSGFHSRGHLPHLKREGGSYFVTFRLEGTLPREVLLRFKQEREKIIAHALAAKRPLTWHEHEALFHWYSERVDKYLDAGHGDCWLKQPTIADLVAGALRFHEGQRFDLQAWVVMSNHVHAVLRPLRGWTLSAILKSWKGYTARAANLILHRTGRAFWQGESYNHLNRDDQDCARLCRYTIMNPVNAGLCRQPEDWKWSSHHHPVS